MPILHYDWFDASRYVDAPDDGASPPLLILHGLFGEANNWRTLATSLATNRPVIVVDLRNHGQSFYAPEMNYQQMAADVLALMDNLDIMQAWVLGHSMGGKVAAQLAFDWPHRLCGLIIADIAPVAYPPRHERIFAGLQAVDLAALTSRTQVFEVLSSYIQDAAISQFLIKNLRRNEQGAWAWRFNLSAIIENYPALSAAPSGSPFTKTTLVIKGERSSYIDFPTHQSAMQQCFPAFTLNIMPDCGHWLHIENPVLFVALVQAYVDSLTTV